MRDLVNLGADALKNVGGAVNHRIQEFDQNAFSGDARRTGTSELGRHPPKRAWFVVANGDELRVCKNKGDDRGFRLIRLGIVDQR